MEPQMFENPRREITSGAAGLMVSSIAAYSEGAQLFRNGDEVILTAKKFKLLEVNAGEILPEYDFSRAARNKYSSKYPAGSAVVVLELMWLPPSPVLVKPTRRCVHWRESFQKHRSRRSPSRRSL